MITSLPIATNQTLKGSITHFNNIDSRVSINKGQYNAIEFSVKSIGKILLELYIAQNKNKDERRGICY